MGDFNQLNWVAGHSPMIRGPVLEIGSRHYASDSAVDYRGLCPGLDFVGTDMSAGPNVDVVADFSADFTTLSSIFRDRRFQTVICCSVLEHCARPADVAANISRIMVPGGVLFLSVPFVWRFHGYPSDYIRLTPEGVKQLFPDHEFPWDHAAISSNVIGDVARLTGSPEELNRFIVRTWKQPAAIPSGSPLIRAMRFGYSLLRSASHRRQLCSQLLGAPDHVAAYPYLLVPANINMVGIKRPAADASA